MTLRRDDAGGGAAVTRERGAAVTLFAAPLAVTAGVPARAEPRDATTREESMP